MRQKIRKGLLLIMFLLFPVTFYYLSPAIIIEGAAKGIIAGSFILFASMFIGSLILGRGFCGWLCPAAGLQESCFGINNKEAVGGKYNLIKYLIWVPWVSIIIYFFIKAGGIAVIDPLYLTNHGISLTDKMGYIIYYIVSGIIVLMALLLGRRAFCHYLCWMAPFMVIGTKISEIIKLPSLKIKSQSSNCIQCGKCNMVCPMSLDVNKMANSESMNNLECILCGSCIDNCPKQVIKYTI